MTVAGFHKNYRPVIAAINGDMATLRIPEMPGGEPLVVRVKNLEKT